jgi:hypothetical protein
MLCVYLYVPRVHEVVLRKKTIFYVAYAKMINFNTKISLFATLFGRFTAHQFFPFLMKLCVHIEYRDIHANIFS